MSCNSTTSEAISLVSGYMAIIHQMGILSFIRQHCRVLFKIFFVPETKQLYFLICMTVSMALKGMLSEFLFELISQNQDLFIVVIFFLKMELLELLELPNNY